MFFVERAGCPSDLIENWSYYQEYVQECKKIQQGRTLRSGAGFKKYGKQLLCCEVYGDPVLDKDQATFAAKGFESILKSMWWSLVTVTTGRRSLIGRQVEGVWSQ